ncbi:hypothetical protein C8R46DRAFT_1067438 [Mycena filopes]|nr:hypothetical protein C8R46DRAFT_1067438 [Mycena filopes]
MRFAAWGTFVKAYLLRHALLLLKLSGQLEEFSEGIIYATADRVGEGSKNIQAGCKQGVTHQSTPRREYILSYETSAENVR